MDTPSSPDAPLVASNAFANAITTYPQRLSITSRRGLQTAGLLVTENGWPLADAALSLTDADLAAREWFGVALHDSSLGHRPTQVVPPAFQRVRAINPFDVRPSRMAWIKRKRNDAAADETFRGLAGLLTTLCEDKPNIAALAEALAWCRNHPGAVGSAFADPLNDEGFIEGSRVLGKSVIDLTDTAIARGEAGLVSEQSLTATVEGLAHLARLLHGVAALAAQTVAATDHVVVVGDTWANVIGFTMKTTYGATVTRVDMRGSAPLVGPAATDPYGAWLEERVHRGLRCLIPANTPARAASAPTPSATLAPTPSPI